MRIIVETASSKSIRLRIPTGLIINPLTAWIAAKVTQENDVTLTYEQACALFAALKDFKRTHGEWKLVEIESANGDFVEITI